jgi:sugar phosphate isomerase/epimerase
VPQIRVGIQLASLRLPFRKALEQAARMGADAVEIDARQELKPAEISRTGLRQIRTYLDNYNLRVAAVSFRTRRGYDVPAELDRRLTATKETLRFAYELGCSVVINQIGTVPKDSSGPAWDTLIQALSDLGSYSQRVGAFLAAETGTESGPDLARLIHALPIGSLTVNLDPGNLIINGFSAQEATQALGDHVVHVHARDAVRDLARGRGLETLLGRGSVDFPELLGTLEEHAYHGYFTIVREQSDDPITEIGYAVKYLRSL